MGYSKDEYLMLRQEILHLDDIIHNQISILYVAEASILAFAINQGNSLLLLITYVVILPVYLVVVNKSDGMYKISGYMAAKLEGEEFNWENNLIDYNKRYVKVRSYTKQAYDFPFVFSSIMTTILFFMSVDYSRIKSIYVVTQVLIAIVLLICVMLIFFSRYKIKNRTEDSKNNWNKI